MLLDSHNRFHPAVKQTHKHMHMQTCTPHTYLFISKEASILWSHHEETWELSTERDNARNNARCMQARKTTHGLDGQHQDVDRTPRRRVNQNDRGQG